MGKKIQDFVVHKVGNKSNDEFLSIAKNKVFVGDEIKSILTQFFFNSFKTQEYYNLFHESDLELNEVFFFVSKIFDNSQELYEQSVNLAKHLFEKSNHPKIKSGEFYVVYFENCDINGHTTNAVGLFKSENKETFLKVYQSGEDFNIETQEGININKLDKGCIVYNIEKENGYILSVVDNTNKSVEAQYWFDDFLHVRQRKDEYYNTQNVLSLCKTFVTKELPSQFDISKADQADLLNKSVKFFKEKDSFNITEFEDEVICQAEVIECFSNFKKEYQECYDVNIEDEFTISEQAVKKQSRIFKSVIKLDKNFHIYVHGNNQYIKKGFDEETGLSFYQLFFKEEE